MRNIFYLALFVCLSVLLFDSCKSNKENKLYTIGLIQLIDAPILDTSRIGIIEGLAEKGFVEGKNISISYKNAQGDMSNVPMILKSFTNDKVDMIITITTPCMVASARTIKETPVVFSVAFSPQQMGIASTPSNMTGISDPMDMADFIKYVKQILPNIKRIGMPYNNAEANSVFATGKVESECKKNNIELIKVTVNGTNDIPQAAEALAQKNIDAVVVSADNTVNAGLQSLIKITNKYKLPIFSTAVDLVKQGVCFAIGANYKKWGVSSGHIAASIINGKKPAEIPVKNIDSYTIEVNKKNADLIGLKLPDDIVKSADKVY